MHSSCMKLQQFIFLLNDQKLAFPWATKKGMGTLRDVAVCDGVPKAWCYLLFKTTMLALIAVAFGPLPSSTLFNILPYAQLQISYSCPVFAIFSCFCFYTILLSPPMFLLANNPESLGVK